MAKLFIKDLDLAKICQVFIYIFRISARTRLDLTVRDNFQNCLQAV